MKPLPGQPTEGLQRLRDQSYPFYLLIQAQANGTLDSTADSLGAELDDARARVHVLLDARAGAEESAANVVVANGGSIVGRGEDLISCWLPITNLAKLARDPSIIGLRLARPPILSWAGDNTKLINSPTWNLAGYDGDGVKVAVIDADGVALVL